MKLYEYAPFVGSDTIEEIIKLSRVLRGKKIQNINSTAVGGGVAEILANMIPLLKELEIRASWNCIKGDNNFFDVTKTLHNALHGKPSDITPAMQQIFMENTRRNLQQMEFNDDIVFVHDPQPMALIQARGKSAQKWLWRCHIDISNPYLQAYEFILPWIMRYDAMVISAPNFSKPLPIRQFLISPSIDPLSEKNKELPPEIIAKILGDLHIDPDKPILTQISRFDALKDPLGVIAAYRMVKKYYSCQLILAGGGADDDPEGATILAQVKDRAAEDPDIHVLELPPFSDVIINALQRASTVIIQKSLKEGFGLTVTEGLWKKKPVVATATGGIPRQIRKHRLTGLLVHTVEGCAQAVMQLLQDPGFAAYLGENGREYVRQNFLITRHLRDYIALFAIALNPASRALRLLA